MRCHSTGPQWSEVFLEPNVVELFFRLHFKVRQLPDLCHYSLNCLIQLGCLNGPVVANKEVRVRYISNFLTHFLNLVGNLSLHAQEALGVSLIFRKLVVYNPPDTLSTLNEELIQTVFAHCAQLTCQFCEKAEREASDATEDNLYLEAFDNMIVGWDSLGLFHELILHFSRIFKIND